MPKVAPIAEFMRTHVRLASVLVGGWVLSVGQLLAHLWAGFPDLAWWVWGIAGTIVAQAWAWTLMRKERDEARGSRGASQPPSFRTGNRRPVVSVTGGTGNEFEIIETDSDWVADVQNATGTRFGQIIQRSSGAAAPSDGSIVVACLIPGGRLQGEIFTDPVILRGPGLLHFRGCTVYALGANVPLEMMLFELPSDGSYRVGVVIIENCTFRRLILENIGIAGTAEDLQVFRDAARRPPSSDESDPDVNPHV